MANLKIEIAENGTKTLLTAGKYCDKNIDIEVNVAGGGGAELPEEAFNITGDARYRFGYNGWNWFVDKYGDKVNANITGANSMFRESKELTAIPFKITHNKNATSTIEMTYMFSSCHKLMALPEMGYYRPSSMDALFQSCYRIREIPQSWVDNIDTSYLSSQTSAYTGAQSYMFQSCYSLREVPMRLLIGNPYISGNSSYFYSGFQYCYTLDELVGLPLYFKATYTSNIFTNTFSHCSRAKNIIFETNEDGTAKTLNWKSQTIDLSNYIGWVGAESNILNYNSGITQDDLIKSTNYNSLAEYTAAMESNPNWYTTQYELSRYALNSAIATINSLPDTSAYLASAGGTNTIKFKGAQGSGREIDGVNQRISNLTAEQIAVAAAKGWTVSLV